MSIKERIVSFMNEDAYKPMLIGEILKALDTSKDMKKEILKILNELEEEGRIIRTRNERYAIPEKMNLITGTIQGSQKGFGFLIPDNTEIKDLFISPVDLNGAMHKDRVIVRPMKSNGNLKSPSGKVIRILKRANYEVIGTLQETKNFGFVLPDDKRISQDIFVSKSDFNGARNGQTVIVKIVEWPEKRKNPEGVVKSILGSSDDIETYIMSALIRNEIKTKFPNKVLREAAEITREISKDEIKRRKDFRDYTIVTIDGADAKDLDDAIHIIKRDDGLYELGVHIADVTHYVREGAPLDKEALERGTSVYMPGEVIPMLPKELSNGVCSLNQGEDKLALSVVMTIDGKGKVKDFEIFESIINSKARLIYDDVSDILENDDEAMSEKYRDLIDDFRNMEDLAKILRRKRDDRGCIDFDFQEAKIVLDEDGRAIDVAKYDRRTANRIIEEFMIACNETIAESMFWSKVPFIYRIHESPDNDKIAEFNKFIANFGYFLKGAANVHPKELQSITNKVKGKKEETVINTIMLRSLKKAVYSSHQDKHFGLASEYYCHFTSPIRRYPDLQIHRIIKGFINGRLKDTDKLESLLAKVADQCSINERKAAQLEREVDDIKAAEYMSERIGEEYEGIISSVTSFGVFVELDNTVEGLVHISNMTDDYYFYDERNYSMIGEMTKKTYKIGDVVNVRLVNVNIQKAEIDFVFCRNKGER
ncbi:RNAse R [Dethiosulfatibacter aminovorans DSM 17477]|uniref:Ribonuclease R n=1 Tax=Dethiosulfatibacter aminovorans DSM 17477 TaxID=1121476 RepID=A0A1M6FE17_9FIRM|nr:ribonuclease R [Dethiosulfatibacter aminovorans]SHI95886.1 RNAse R [Dethiosulfatibacter aminovorans DSM 17477]